jgi:hypothetical protein
MNKYRCKWAAGYSSDLTEGRLYEGYEEPGIFADSPYLVIPCGDQGVQTVAHLHRFEKVKECAV